MTTLVAGQVWTDSLPFHRDEYGIWHPGKSGVREEGWAEEGAGRCYLDIIEVLPSRTMGQLAVHRKRYVAPDAEEIYRSSKRVRTASSVKSYISRYKMKEVHGL